MGNHCGQLANCYEKNGGNLPDQRENSGLQTPQSDLNRRKRFIATKKDLMLLTDEKSLSSQTPGYYGYDTAQPSTLSTRYSGFADISLENQN